MRYLSCALLAEGTSDDRIYPGLLGRALERMCAHHFDFPVEVADVMPVRCRTGPPSVEEILGVAARNSGSFDLVFAHRDAGANGERVEREWREPLRQRWTAATGRLVTVVPMRETEAWILADGQALRRALGVSWSDDELGVPRSAAAVERVPDPKVPLQQLGIRIRRPVTDYYERLAGLITLDVLDKVPSFARWREDTLQALRELWGSGR
ncbi:hypothetical protein GCM10010124_09990 [Pilimelia terevasa]|uniref:DUF4276 family protein n=1 Tax=Pilimelia terevasa TaxID=53372 RepID=A0A8J3BG15_9ACTN|nr:DUF4276 family protein [Pilimelia terevasa]GGK19392.1 hypothetical protein GCM10010124_09990 [Pilimelia terevasa]